MLRFLNREGGKTEARSRSCEIDRFSGLRNRLPERDAVSKGVGNRHLAIPPGLVVKTRARVPITLLVVLAAPWAQLLGAYGPSDGREGSDVGGRCVAPCRAARLRADCLGERRAPIRAGVLVGPCRESAGSIVAGDEETLIAKDSKRDDL